MLELIFKSGQRPNSISAKPIEGAATANPASGLVTFCHNGYADRTYLINCEEDGPHYYNAGPIVAFISGEGRYVLLHHIEGGYALIRRPHGVTQMQVVETKQRVYAGFAGTERPIMIAAENGPDRQIMDMRRWYKWCNMNCLLYDSETSTLTEAGENTGRRNRINRNNNYRRRHHK